MAVIVTDLYSQEDSTSEEKIFIKVERLGGFPGGDSSWNAFLEKNLKYPKKAKRQHVEGIVKVQFEVSRKGLISNIKLLEDPGSGLGEEAVRLIKLSGTWLPMEQGGRPVLYKRVQDIVFSLKKDF